MRLYNSHKKEFVSDDYELDKENNRAKPIFYGGKMYYLFSDGFYYLNSLCEEIRILRKVWKNYKTYKYFL